MLLPACSRNEIVSVGGHAVCLFQSTDIQEVIQMFKLNKSGLIKKSRIAVANKNMTKSISTVAANKTDVRVAGSTAKSKPETATRKITAKPVGQVRAAANEEDRQEMIAIAAYYRAERRGFSGGDAMQDWLEAEAEIDGAVHH